MRPRPDAYTQSDRITLDISADGRIVVAEVVLIQARLAIGDLAEKSQVTDD